MNWDEYFISMVYFVSMKSKDQSTKIGAVIVDDNHRIVSTGYNGFPRGADESGDKWERPNKYERVIHAEVNSILNSNSKLEGCIMYTNGIPCLPCAGHIIQVGIKEVVVDRIWDDENYNQWLESAKKTKQLFSECGVNIRYYEGDLISYIKLFRNGEEWNGARKGLYLIRGTK